jgi:hypothetical protein
MADDDFNSSDIEIPDKPNPYARLGEDSINSMLNRQFEDRVESKIAPKQLQQVTGAPSTQINRALWFQRFTKFCEGTLRHKYVPVLHLTTPSRHDFFPNAVSELAQSPKAKISNASSLVSSNISNLAGLIR